MNCIGAAFTHFNTGISELEYFGHGRFMVMNTNHTPHFSPSQYTDLRSGGSLKDGWSYVMPADEFVSLNAEVSVAFSDEELEGHVREQATALKALYLSSGESQSLKPVSSDLEVEEEQGEKRKNQLQFIVKRGLQVVGVATYSDETGQLSDVAIRPTAAGDRIGATLMEAVKKHARKIGRSDSLTVHPRSQDSRVLFESMGFSELQELDEDKQKMMTSIH
jgi:N-acetylglutamate synthase-like GNAT family acetyltransferase